MKSSVEFRTSFNRCESAGFKNSGHLIAIDFYDVCRNQQHLGSSCDAVLHWSGVMVELRALQKEQGENPPFARGIPVRHLMLYTEYFSHTFAAFCKREIYSYIHTQFKNSNIELALKR